VFENKVLRGIFGPKRDKVTGDWRKVQNEYIYMILVGKPEGMKTLGRRDVGGWII
jgi:hypothetical protein